MKEGESVMRSQELSKIRISRQFPVPAVRKAMEFDLPDEVRADVFPEEVVVRHVPILHGKQACAQHAKGLIQSMPSCKAPESERS